MAKLLMITGLGSAVDLASGKRGAFYNTLEEFSKYWDRIDIIAPKISRGSTSGGFEVEPLFGNVFIHVSPWPLIFHPIWFVKKGIEIYKEQKFDLMTVHEFPPFYNGIGARLLWQKINPHTHFGQFLKKIFLPWQKSKVSVGVKVPYVLEIHHVPGYPKTANFKEKIYRNLVKWFIKFDASRAVAVRVVNKKQTPGFLIKAGMPQNKIIYIPSTYIDLEVFKPMNLSKEFDLIFVGRLEKNKGINFFLGAVKELNCRALIVGDGSLMNEIKFKIQNSKFKIILHGWAKDSQEVADLMNKSKILVMPSYNEGGPRVVLEAMACGVPVLATPVGMVSDLGSAVVRIDWNSEDIAKKASRVLNNELEYIRLSQGGLEIVKQFEKKAAIKNYADKLKTFLG